MIVFDTRMIYDEHERQLLIKEDRFFTGENHHWALRFHKCLQEEMEMPISYATNHGLML